MISAALQASLPYGTFTTITMEPSSIYRPATRRIRCLPTDSDTACEMVYVGPNPVIKKTVKMLRKRTLGFTTTTSTPDTTCLPVPPEEPAVKINPRKANRRRATKTAPADIPKAPCRKASNPFLKGGLVDEVALPTANTYRMTRSRSRQAIKASLALKAPCRKPSVNDMAKANTYAPCLPHRKPSNPFLKGFGLVDCDSTAGTSQPKSLHSMNVNSAVPMSLKSLNKSLRLQQEPTNGAMGRTPSPPPSLPQRKASNPFLRGFDIQSFEKELPTTTTTTTTTRSTTRRPTRRVTIDAPQAPRRKESIPDFSFQSQIRRTSLVDGTGRCSTSTGTSRTTHKEVNFLDLDWDKITL